MKKEVLQLWDDFGELYEAEVLVGTKADVIEFMKDQNKDDYCMELYAPDTFKYDEKLLDEECNYFIQNNTIELIVE